MVSKREAESVLEVSVRWSHVNIVRYLLAEVDYAWTKEQISASYQHVKEEKDNPELKRLLRVYSKIKFGKLYTCFTFS